MTYRHAAQLLWLALLQITSLAGQQSWFNGINEYPTSQCAQGIAIADFNHDGNLDVVSAGAGQGASVGGSAELSILFGKGDGTFLNGPVSPDLGWKVVAVGDFNGDGNPDIATVSHPLDGFGSLRIQLLLGNGDGTFQRPPPYSIPIPQGGSPSAMLAGDFNRDGKLDLVYLDSALNLVQILLGDGVGNFSTGATLDAGRSPASIAVADINADGSLDLAIASSGSNEILVFLGDGHGNFSSPARYPGPKHLTSVHFADLTGGGFMDMLATHAAPGEILIFRGRGDGSFQPATFLPAPYIPSDLLPVDFDQDGRLDLVVSHAGYGGTGRLGWYRGNGDGSFQPLQNIEGGIQYGYLATGDFNNDGRPDLALSGPGVAIMIHNGRDGVINAPRIDLDQPLPFALAKGDLDGDGLTDLAVGLRGGVAILLSNGRGTFAARPTISVPGVDFHNVALGDLNRDGKRDLVGLYAGGAYVWLGSGGGDFQSPAIYPTTTYPNDAQIADLNGDGNKDLIIADSQSEVLVFLNQGNGTFGEPLVTALPETVNHIVVGDFNKDGKKDLAVISYFQVYILLGNGDGTFQSAQSLLPATQPLLLSVAAGQFTESGNLDLAVLNNSWLFFLLGNGDGTFQTPLMMLHSLNNPQSIVAGDFNGDGRLDVAVSDVSKIGVFPGQGDGPFGTASFVATPESSIAGPFSAAIEAVSLSGGRRLDLVALSRDGLTSLINITP